MAGAALWPAIAATTLACGTALPQPPRAQVAQSDYVPVPFPPRTPPVEYVPPRPVEGAVWIDGSWEWTGDRYGWSFGTWVVPPPGARRARWVVVRRQEDGQLFFASSSWKDAAGNRVDDTSWAHALGPAARARSRPGASTPWLPYAQPTTPPVESPEEDTDETSD